MNDAANPSKEQEGAQQQAVVGLGIRILQLTIDTISAGKLAPACGQVKAYIVELGFPFIDPKTQ